MLGEVITITGIIMTGETMEEIIMTDTEAINKRPGLFIGTVIAAGWHSCFCKTKRLLYL
jgi:hypothetical protein